VYWPPPDWGLVRHMEPTISMPWSWVGKKKRWSTKR
jgi:hypothetical protein